jgi:hypothetical protein
MKSELHELVINHIVNKKYETIKDNIVLVYDREPRNKEIVKQIEKSINKGYTVCLLPDNLPGKDINDMIADGLTEKQIMNLIEENTFSGLTAKLKFVEWKKC